MITTLRLLTFITTVALCITGVRSAEPARLRLAVGPFFAPQQNESLRQASSALPELLTAKLAQSNQFELLEREKVQAIWNELHLNASGLVARDKVTQFGRMLACDWLVTGSLVASAGKTQVWTKIIDMRTGVVAQMEAFPCENSRSEAALESMSLFLSKARTAPKPQQFITLGRFMNMNPSASAGRDDWSRQIPALIEKNFQSLGFGVVELEAVHSIFEEQQLESAGLTGQAEARVKIQPAFWIIDGGFAYASTTANTLTVGLRVQRVGEAPQTLRFPNLESREVENTIVEALRKALNPNSIIMTGHAAKKAEAKLLVDRGTELAEYNSPFRQQYYPAQRIRNFETDHDQYGNRVRVSLGGDPREMYRQLKEKMENRQKSLATYERLILLDPKNMRAKQMLGYALLGDRDPAQRERGKILLQEVVASGDPQWAQYAKGHLERIDFFVKQAEDAARHADWIEGVAKEAERKASLAGAK